MVRRYKNTEKKKGENREYSILVNLLRKTIDDLDGVASDCSHTPEAVCPVGRLLCWSALLGTGSNDSDTLGQN